MPCRHAITAVLAACSLLALTAPAAAGASTAAPTRAQIAAAVRRAEHSRSLWATINICDTTAHPDAVGIRGQIPALGFPATLTLTIQITYQPPSGHGFIPVPGATARRTLSLGRHSAGLHQDGYTLRFTPPAVLSATITFSWTVHGRVIGTIRRTSTGGERHVDGGDPPGYSAATCRIPG